MMNQRSKVFFKEFGRQLRISENRMAHFYPRTDVRKRTAPAKSTGAVLRHDFRSRDRTLLRCGVAKEIIQRALIE